MTQHEKDVEKVARAIQEVVWGTYGFDFHDMAEAALKAMKPAPLEPIPGSGPLK